MGHEPKGERAGANISFWEATAGIGSDGALKGDATTEICIVGAGIAGLSVAYALVNAGREVIVLDDGPIGRGMTSRTTAHLVTALDDRYYDLEKYFREDGARMAAQSHTAAIDRVEQIVRDEKIDCEFERLDGFLFEPPNESLKNLEKEYDACVRCGIDVQWVDRAPMEGLDTGRTIRFPRQAQFHPLKYLAGLTTAIRRKGGRIYTNTRVQDASGGDDAQVKTQGGQTIRCNAVVIATNSPINDRYVIHTKQAPYTTYVVGLRAPKGALTKALYWDTAERAGMESQIGPIPYHYVRLSGSGDNGDEILIVGGEDHKTGQTEKFEPRFYALEEWARVRWPQAGEVAFKWSGQVMEPVDSLGYIGRNPADKDNVFVVTGDSGNGMTHGTIAGMLIPALIERGEHPWEKLYDPSRVTLRTTPDFAKENANVAAQYLDYFTGGDAASANELGRGQGAVIRDGLKKLAVYRDASGKLHEMSAVCPHLKCIVHWNKTEKTWDCPCHGSRFACTGDVLNGPATGPLNTAR